MDKVLPGEIFILTSFNVKALTQVNSQQMLMNFNGFPNSSQVNCVIRINFSSDEVHKDGSCCDVTSSHGICCLSAKGFIFRVMRFISSRNTNGPENQVGCNVNDLSQSKF